MQLSVNASPALVLDPGFHAVLETAGRLRERLVVDDTGAGYTPSTHMLRLRPDIIKLDGSLLADIDSTRRGVHS